MLGMAGLPIYIHAPKFFVESYGISLSALGVALFALRLLDFVQDPLLGRLAERTLNLRSLPIWVAAVVMGLGMFGLLYIKKLKKLGIFNTFVDSIFQEDK